MKVLCITAILALVAPAAARADLHLFSLRAGPVGFVQGSGTSLLVFAAWSPSYYYSSWGGIVGDFGVASMVAAPQAELPGSTSATLSTSNVLVPEISLLARFIPFPNAGFFVELGPGVDFLGSNGGASFKATTGSGYLIPWYVGSVFANYSVVLGSLSVLQEFKVGCSFDFSIGGIR
ncbi:MAG: hypothetical protein ACXVCH_17060 [Bdellovibrionota bacterium]